VTLDASSEHLLRELAPQVLGAVIRRFGNFGAAEDAVQEALLAAALRSEASRRQRETVAASLSPATGIGMEPEEDDTLVLLFMCCHPALTESSAIALMLRAVGGLTTAEIAHAFLVPEATMAQRISRAKRTIQESGVPFELPTRRTRAERLRTVLHVLYLVFNEGYITSEGVELQRKDLAAEAIRLTRCVRTLLPDDCEVAGLLALMLLTDARRAARSGSEGELIPLTRQDRTLWDQAEIAEGVALISATLPKGQVGPYQLQAAIGAVHDEAASAEETDWPQILALYELLKRMSDNPMIVLNHAIAAAMVHGPAKGLELLDGLHGLDGHHRLAAVRAHLLEMAGDSAGAIAHYRLAAERTTNLPERNYLITQAARLQENSRPG
jgi:predicted RNA polymerase sigma factor